MVASVDGFIARKDNDISWMQSSDQFEAGVTLSETYIEDFLKSIDCYVMGDGTLFFDYIGQEQPLHLKDLKAYKDGMVELHYQVKKLIVTSKIVVDFLK